MTEGTQATRPYLQRVVEEELEELTSSLPAAAIVGAKGVGKTATATRRATTVHALDDPAQRSVARADPARLLDSTTPILIDEWQYVPGCWVFVRRAVDAGADRGRFLLTGSASPAEVESHSGAGRIVSTRMRPLALAERLVGQSLVSLRELLAGERPPVGDVRARGSPTTSARSCTPASLVCATSREGHCGPSSTAISIGLSTAISPSWGTRSAIRPPCAAG